MRLSLDQRTDLYKKVLEISGVGFFTYDSKKNKWSSLHRNNLPFLNYDEALPFEIINKIKTEALNLITEKRNGAFPFKNIELPDKENVDKTVQIKITDVSLKAKGHQYLVLVTDAGELMIKQKAKDEEQSNLFELGRQALSSDLGAGVSHEINNPLAIILGRAQTLNIKLHRGQVPTSEVIETLDKIENNVKRISKIVLSLRMMTKNSTDENAENISVASLFEDLASFWSERLKSKDYEFTLLPGENDLEVYGQRSLLITALFNMISNSFEATRKLKVRWIRLECSRVNNQLLITVTDSGSGIAEMDQKRIFDPFFTTREAEKSSGLGLSVTKGIFEYHNGHIEYDNSCPNTRFNIRIPLAVHHQVSRNIGEAKSA